MLNILSSDSFCFTKTRILKPHHTISMDMKVPILLAYYAFSYDSLWFLWIGLRNGATQWILKTVLQYLSSASSSHSSIGWASIHWGALGVIVLLWRRTEPRHHWRALLHLWMTSIWHHARSWWVVVGIAYRIACLSFSEKFREERLH